MSQAVHYETAPKDRIPYHQSEGGLRTGRIKDRHMAIYLKNAQ